MPLQACFSAVGAGGVVVFVVADGAAGFVSGAFSLQLVSGAPATKAATAAARRVLWDLVVMGLSRFECGWGRCDCARVRVAAYATPLRKGPSSGTSNSR